jgi:hypothetical protein
MPTNDEKLAALEDKAVKYAIAVEARDSIHSYLKYWSAFGAVVLAVCGGYGWTAKQATDRIDTSLQQQYDRLIALERQATTVSASVTAQQATLDTRFQALREKTDELNNNTHAASADAKDLARTAAEFSKTRWEGIEQLQNSLHEGQALIASAEHARGELDRQIGQAQQQIAATGQIVRDLGEVATHAKQFDQQIATHSSVFRKALLDHMTLQSNTQSPQVELAAADGKHKYIVWFFVPNIKREPFDITYHIVTRDINAPTDSPVDDKVEHVLTGVGQVVPRKRKWNIMDLANGEYQFAGDFVFNSHFARDFVNVRIAATEKLIAPFGSTVASK